MTAPDWTGVFDPLDVDAAGVRARERRALRRRARFVVYDGGREVRDGDGDSDSGMDHPDAGRRNGSVAQGD
jgi:hypothetical protein